MQILGIPIDKLVYKDFFDSITKLDKKSIIFTPNPEIILKTQEDSEFKDMILKADYLLPDGTGLYIAAQINECKSKKDNYVMGVIYSIILLPYFVYNIIFMKKKLYRDFGDKICGSDLTLDLIKYANLNKIKVTILDLYNPNDEKKVASQKEFANKLKLIYNDLDFDYIIYDYTKKEEIINQIRSSNSKILFSTLGMKKQEESVIEVMSECDNIMIGTGIGSSFDYITGFQKRAPLFWRTLGIEWMYRLITGPQKMKRLKRLYNAIIIFIYKVILTK